MTDIIGALRSLREGLSTSNASSDVFCTARVPGHPYDVKIVT